MIATNLAGVANTSTLKKFWGQLLPGIENWKIAVGYICEGSTERLRVLAEEHPALKMEPDPGAFFFVVSNPKGKTRAHLSK